MTNQQIIRAGILAVAGLLTSATAVATPQTMAFSGRILDVSGSALNAQQAVRISLHTDAVTGSEVWFETHTVTAIDGYFSVTLGGSTALMPALRDNGAL